MHCAKTNTQIKIPQNTCNLKDDTQLPKVIYILEYQHLSCPVTAKYIYIYIFKEHEEGGTMKNHGEALTEHLPKYCIRTTKLISQVFSSEMYSGS